MTMPLNINLHTVNNLPKWVKLTKYKTESHHAPKEKKPFIDVLTDETKEAGTPNSVIKFIRGILGVVKAVPGTSPKFATAHSYASSFTQFWRFIDVVNLTKTLVNEHDRRIPIENPKAAEKTKRDRNLAIAAASVGVFFSALNGVRLFDTIGVYKLSLITKALGAGAVNFPFVFVLSVVDVIKSSLSIAIEAIKVNEWNKKIKHATKKLTDWKVADLKSPAFAHQKVITTANKMIALRGEIDFLLPLEEAAYNKAQPRVDKVAGKKPSCIEKGRVKKLVNKHHVLKSVLEDKIKKFNKLEVKKGKWEAIENRLMQANVNPLTNEETKSLEQLKKDELKKWDIKKVNFKWNKAKNAAMIFFHCMIVTAALAACILGGLGLIMLPAVAITLASAWLLISTMSLGMHFFKKFKNDKAFLPINLPQLGGGGGAGAPAAAPAA